MTPTIRTWAVSHAPQPRPPFVQYGVAIGPDGGCIVGARWVPGQPPLVTDFERFGTHLRDIGQRIEQLRDQDPTARIVIDDGLHGGDLWFYLGQRRARRHLRLFTTSNPPRRRVEIAGRLRALYDREQFGIRRLMGGALTLRAAINQASRDDAAERVEVVALALAVIPGPGTPRIG